jgi:hypothetical protein
MRTRRPTTQITWDKVGVAASKSMFRSVSVTISQRSTGILEG